MLKRWIKRRKIQEQWEQMLLLLTSNAANVQIDKKEQEKLCKLFANTMWLYGEDNYINKATLRLFYFLKRVLADKRQYDTIKIIDYIVLGHTVRKKVFINQEVKDRLIAHCLQMANLYMQMILNNKPSNPFAPGQTIGE